MCIRWRVERTARFCPTARRGRWDDNSYFGRCVTKEIVIPDIVTNSRDDSGSHADTLASLVLGLKRLSTAARMVALAGKLCDVLSVFANFAAVLLLVGGNTATCRVGTFLHFAHLFSLAAPKGCRLIKLYDARLGFDGTVKKLNRATGHGVPLPVVYWLQLRGPATSAMKQGKNAHSCLVQAIGHDIWSSWNDQLSGTVYSSGTAHLRKVDELFNSSQNHLHLLLSRRRVIFHDEVKCGRKLFGSLPAP